MADDLQSPTDDPWLQDASEYRRHPRAPYLPNSRRFYDGIYETAVRKRYELFQNEVWLSEDDKARIEERVHTAVLTINGYNAWSEFHQKNYEEYRGMSFWAVLLPGVAIALLLPFFLDADQFSGTSARRSSD